MENELCPVFVARCPDPEDLRPDPTEVDDVAWVPWPELRDDVLADRREVSRWCAEQVAALPADLAGAPAADDALLPAGGAVTPAAPGITGAPVIR